MISFPSNKSYIKVKEEKKQGRRKKKIKVEIVSIIKGENRVYGVKRSEEKVKRDAFFFLYQRNSQSQQTGRLLWFTESTDSEGLFTQMQE